MVASQIYVTGVYLESGSIKKPLDAVKSKVKLSRYTPWRHMGGEEV
jgi:hypothetical protein